MHTVGDPSSEWMEELVVDEATGELYLIYAPSLDALDALAGDVAEGLLVAA